MAGGSKIKEREETYLTKGIYKDEYGRLYRKDGNFIFMLNFPEAREFKKENPEFF